MVNPAASLTDLDPRLQRAMPFIAVVVLGLLAWQLPVLAERGGADELAGAEPIQTLAPGAPASATTTTVAESTPTTSLPAPALSGPSDDSALSFAPSAPAPPSESLSSPPTTQAAAPSAPTTSAAGPRRVTRSTWAQSSVRRGTPLEEAPDDVLPIEMFSSGASRTSYVEVRGTDGSLSLAVSDTEPTGLNADPPGLAACPIVTAFWERNDGQSFESAPPHDPDACTEGVEADGTWTFDLSAYGTLEAHPGFAIIPVTPGTWSVWLTRP